MDSRDEELEQLEVEGLSVKYLPVHEPLVNKCATEPAQ
jgi:hypothetical protein